MRLVSASANSLLSASTRRSSGIAQRSIVSPLSAPARPADRSSASFWCAWRTIAGYEAIHMIRKGQAYGRAAATKVGLVHRFILGLFAATN